MVTRAWGFGALLWMAPLAVAWPTTAAAQDAWDNELPPGMQTDGTGDSSWDPDFFGDEAVSQPARLVFTFGVGGSFRLVQDLDFAQERSAPGFLDGFGSYVFGTSSFLRHGLGLGLSMNLTGDGSVSVGVNPAEQIAISPAYLAYLRLGDDFIITAKASAHLVVSPQLSLGAGAEVGAAYLFSAGMGIYFETGLHTFIGSDSTTHPIASIEGGVVIDYEVLP